MVTDFKSATADTSSFAYLAESTSSLISAT